MAEEEEHHHHHHHLLHHEKKEETPEDLKEEMKHHKHIEHASEGIAASAGVYALVIYPSLAVYSPINQIKLGP